MEQAVAGGYKAREPGRAKRMLMGSLMVATGFLIVPALAFYGYLVRIAREAWYDPDSGLPEWDDFRELVSTGLKLAAAGLIYAIPSIALLACGVIAALQGGKLTALSLSLIGAGLVLGLVFWLLLLPVTIELARDLSLRDALDPREVWRTFATAPGTWVRLMVEFFVSFLLAGLGILLAGVGIFFTIPWAFYSFSQQLGEEAHWMGV